MISLGGLPFQATFFTDSENLHQNWEKLCPHPPGTPWGEKEQLLKILREKKIGQKKHFVEILRFGFTWLFALGKNRKKKRLGMRIKIPLFL